MKIAIITAAIVTLIYASLYYFNSTYTKVVVVAPLGENDFKAIILNANNFDELEMESLMIGYRKGKLSFREFRNKVEALIKNANYSVVKVDSGKSRDSVYCIKGSCCLISFRYESIYIHFFEAGSAREIQLGNEDLFD